MPFQSQAQRRFMYANNPAVANEFQSKTPPGPLPQYAPNKPEDNRQNIRHKAMRRMIGDPNVG